MSRGFPESRAEPVVDGERFLRKPQRLCAIAEAEMHRRHRPEHFALPSLELSLPSNRERLLQNFERASCHGRFMTFASPRAW